MLRFSSIPGRSPLDALKSSFCSPHQVVTTQLSVDFAQCPRTGPLAETQALIGLGFCGAGGQEGRSELPDPRPLRSQSL